MSCDCWMCLCCAEIFFGAWYAVAANADCRTQNVVHGTNAVGWTDGRWCSWGRRSIQKSTGWTRIKFLSPISRLVSRRKIYVIPRREFEFPLFPLRLVVSRRRKIEMPTKSFVASQFTTFKDTRKSQSPEKLAKQPLYIKSIESTEYNHDPSTLFFDNLGR